MKTSCKPWHQDTTVCSCSALDPSNNSTSSSWGGLLVTNGILVRGDFVSKRWRPLGADRGLGLVFRSRWSRQAAWCLGSSFVVGGCGSCSRRSSHRGPANQELLEGSAVHGRLQQCTELARAVPLTLVLSSPCSANVSAYPGIALHSFFRQGSGFGLCRLHCRRAIVSAVPELFSVVCWTLLVLSFFVHVAVV